jgi:hypothetical protein
MTGRAAGAVAATALLAALALSWAGTLDRLAGERTQAAFERALVTFALARTLNGVISVAQGTELAFQPAGVGVVITAGEILDPLNDLVEQFSWFVLVAASSLGVQIVLGELFATLPANLAVTAIGLAAAALLVLRPPGDRLRTAAARIAVGLLFVRFAVVLAALVTTWIGEHALAARESASIDYLKSTSRDLEADADRAAPAAPEDAGTIERIEQFLDESRAALGESLDVRARLQRLEARAETAIAHVVDLIVVYLLETVLLPLGVLALAWAGLRRLLPGGA